MGFGKNGRNGPNVRSRVVTEREIVRVPVRVHFTMGRNVKDQMMNWRPVTHSLVQVNITKQK